MRPLAIEPIAGVPPFILGLAVIRASAVAVIDAAMLLGGAPSSPTRFVTVKIGNRRLALAVDVVLGVRTIRANALEALPPLLQHTSAVSAVGTLDEELLLLLRSARIVPDEVWTAIDAGAST